MRQALCLICKEMGETFWKDLISISVRCHPCMSSTTPKHMKSLVHNISIWIFLKNRAYKHPSICLHVTSTSLYHASSLDFSSLLFRFGSSMVVNIVVHNDSFGNRYEFGDHISWHRISYGSQSILSEAIRIIRFVSKWYFDWLAIGSNLFLARFGLCISQGGVLDVDMNCVWMMMQSPTRVTR